MPKQSWAAQQWRLLNLYKEMQHRPRWCSCNNHMIYSPQQGNLTTDLDEIKQHKWTANPDGSKDLNGQANRLAT